MLTNDRSVILLSWTQATNPSFELMTSNFVALIYEEDYTALPQGPKDSPGCVKNDSNSTNFTNFETVRPTTVSPTVDHVDWEIEIYS